MVKKDKASREANTTGFFYDLTLNKGGLCIKLYVIW